MSCCGKHKDRNGTQAQFDSFDILPTEECIFCGEKHFSTAYALAVEKGYESPNRQRIIGELVAAQWHLWKKAPAIAARLRDIRHTVQQRKESSIRWTIECKIIDDFIKSNIK